VEEEVSLLTTISFASSMPKALDIAEAQVLVHFPEDPVPYHHRVLFHRVSGSTWVVLTPDKSVQVTDIGKFTLRSLTRNSRPPRGLGGVYMFDELEPEEFAVLRAEARRLAATLGADVQGVQDKSLGACWRFADPACERSAEEGLNPCFWPGY